MTEVSPSLDIVPNWTPITEEFIETCQDLKLGQLLHDSGFGLFEAMSAIEMMDPKMDAGMLCNQAKRPVHNFEQALQAGEVKINHVTHEELIQIIDGTLACLVTWLEGHSLAQTVFTNLYLHNPYIIEDRQLKAFSICFLRIVDLIRDRVNRAGVFEEEDFQVMTYGFKLASDVSDVRAIGMVREVEDDTHRVIKNTRSRPGEEQSDDVVKEHWLMVAVHARLKFCRLFLATLQSFSKEKCLGIEDCRKFLYQMAELVPLMEKTMILETVAGDKDSKPVMGFEPLVNQRLLPPTFPRYTKIKTLEETMDYLGQLIARMKAACDVVDVSGLHNILEFFQEFSKQSPCALSRSLLQLTFLSPNRRVFGNTPIVDSLSDAIRTFISPSALMLKGPFSNNPKVKVCVDTFLMQAVMPITTMFQITGHNRARQRDRWAHILEDLASLQEEADKVDAFLHSIVCKQDPNRHHMPSFGTFVLYHTLRVMVQYVLGGFELELYAVYEYHYIYWYLYECLYNWLISALSRADTYLYEQETLAEQQKGRGNKKSRKKKKPRLHERQITLEKANQNMCGGYYKAIAGLTMDQKLTQPNFEFDNEEVRYNHRFAPFGCVTTPPPVQYPNFKEMTDLGKYQWDAEDLYASACKGFQQAKVLYESLASDNAEVQTLTKIAKTNFVVLKLLLGGHRKHSKEPPEFDFSLHNAFPVIKLS